MRSIVCLTSSAAPPTPASFQQRTFSTSSRSSASDSNSSHVPRTPTAEDAGAGYHASQVPNFTKYTGKTSEAAQKGFSYFAIGTMGLITAAGAKSLVSDFLKNMSASADVLALAKVEVDMNSIPEGKNVIIKVGWLSVSAEAVILAIEERHSGVWVQSRMLTSIAFVPCRITVARKARFHSTPNIFRDRRGERSRYQVSPRSSEGQRPSPET